MDEVYEELLGLKRLKGQHRVSVFSNSALLEIRDVLGAALEVRGCLLLVEKARECLLLMRR